MDTPLEIMLRDLRELRADRREPCGVHERPQWTCAFCLCNLLVELDELRSSISETCHNCGCQEIDRLQ